MTASLAPQGSTLWLLGHEMRLVVRGWGGRRNGRLTLAIALLGLGAAGAFAGVPIARVVARAPLRLTGPLILGLDGGLLAVFTLILSQTLSATVSAFYDRGDLELLLSSPTPPGRVLTVRSVSVALTPGLWFALFVTPFLGPLAIIAGPVWLLDYLVLAALALLASAVGLGIAMAMFRLIGARATRTFGQILAAFVGAGFFLASQARSLLPDHGAGLGRLFLALTQSKALDPDAPLAWPARAATGDLAALGGLVAVSLAVFTALTFGLGRRFAEDASVAAGALMSTPRRQSAALRRESFRSGPFQALLIKELRLLMRDPILLSQVLLRTLYVVPLTLLITRNGAHSQAASGGLSLVAAAGAVVFMAGQVAGSLAWITISAEDAPELLACAPVAGGLTRRAKLTATLIPVAALMSAPVGVLIALRPWIGVCAGLGALGAAGSSGLINLWFEKPATRRVFGSRRGGSMIGASSELILGFGWAVTAALAASGTLLAGLGLGLTLAALGGLYAAARPDRRY